MIMLAGSSKNNVPTDTIRIDFIHIDIHIKPPISILFPEFGNNKK
jgi:hypothetical protein